MSGAERIGRGQPANTHILTQAGWKRLSEVKVGERLASLDGKENLVTEVRDEGVQQTVRTTFWDGRFVDCATSHPWRIVYCGHAQQRLFPASSMRAFIDNEVYRGKVTTEVFGGAWEAPDCLPIHPYVLGVLLGDGCFRQGVIFTNSDEDIVDRVERLLRDGLIVVSDTPIQHRITSPARDKYERTFGRGGHPILRKLKSLGLWGLLSYEKFIPSVYLRAGMQDRIELLRGLLDTDGCVEKEGQVKYSTSSEKLSSGVKDLVWSLGGLAKSKFQPNTHRGIHIVSIWHPRTKALFALPRKVERCHQRRRDLQGNTISTIEPVGRADCISIQVSHETGLYVTSGFTMVHC